jgi:hypothetical protein
MKCAWEAPIRGASAASSHHINGVFAADMIVFLLAFRGFARISEKGCANSLFAGYFSLNDGSTPPS